jgi:hypothetical protein
MYPISTSEDTSTTTNPISNNPSSVQIPILRGIDKPSSSLPSKLTFTEDIIRASVGFRKIETMKRHLHKLYQDTITLDSLPPDAVLDVGDVATLPKVPWSTTPVPRPQSFLDEVHMDIVFGPDIALGNVYYGLLFTDRYSRMTYIYPLQNIISDIKQQMEAFFAHLGMCPKRIII